MNQNNKKIRNEVQHIYQEKYIHRHLAVKNIKTTSLIKV